MKTWFCSLLGLSLCVAASAQSLRISIQSTQDPQQKLGTITAHDSRYGLILTPQLRGLPPGIHGFHIHQKPNCGQHGMAAGGHFDPRHSGHHLGPYNPKGHLGDLPVLIVNKDGRATLPVLAPRLKVKDIVNHSVMIHAGGDNYSDTPHLGGGGKRLACGVIPKKAMR